MLPQGGARVSVKRRRILSNSWDHWLFSGDVGTWEFQRPWKRRGCKTRPCDLLTLVGRSAAMERWKEAGRWDGGDVNFPVSLQQRDRDGAA